VAGIRYCLAQPVDAGEQILTADLVVDASGRSSKAPEWLEDLGYPAPKEAVVDALWGYASRDYEPPAGFEADWKVLLMMNRPPDQPRAGILEWVEGNRWMVTVAGVMGQRPPADEEGFLEFIRGMASPAIYDALRQARPLSRIYLHHRTQNRLRFFDRLTRRPERFVVLGDAVCAFTPVYGQGMTLSALEALELGECLRRREHRAGRLNGCLDGLAARFQKRVAGLVAGPWALATGEDLRWPATVGGEITPRVRFFHWYIDQVIQLIPGSPEVFRRFQEVNHMLKPATALFHPAVLGPVLRNALHASEKPAAEKRGLLSHLSHLLDVLHLRPLRPHH
jgi:2-polyprenyl-6-methoxyphenol hydroxylase-like FAD-dependent oxidoreductase